jgi:hypothetical protein
MTELLKDIANILSQINSGFFIVYMFYEIRISKIYWSERYVLVVSAIMFADVVVVVVLLENLLPSFSSAVYLILRYSSLLFLNRVTRFSILICS